MKPQESTRQSTIGDMGKKDNPATTGNRITRVYTRIGDAGTTRLVGDRVVPKNHPRLHAYGATDELQVAIGLARDCLDQTLAQSDQTALDPLPLIAEHLVYVENLIFTLNGDLATRVEDRWPDMPLIADDMVEYLEALIDGFNRELPPLKDFVLPGGHPATTALHQCRVICRRAEREVAALGQAEPIGDTIRPFLNRLSDLFFVLARRVAHALVRHGLAREEIIWKRDPPRPPLP